VTLVTSAGDSTKGKAMKEVKPTLSRALRIPEFARLANISVRTAYAEIARNAIRTVVSGRRGRRILESDAIAYFNGRASGPKE
jgi:hypothetical protein